MPPRRSALFCIAAPICALMTWQATPNGSEVILRPTVEPGAVAEILFRNSSADPTLTLHRFDLGPYRIEAELGDATPDTLRVEPPEGYIAVPPEITIPDGTDAVIVIYPLEAVGA